MCFESKDAAFAAVCQERDRLREIVEKQARMNRSAAKMALDLDTMTADRDRLQQAYDAMTKDLQIMSDRLRDTQIELKAATAGDIVEVVRCADCQHSDEGVGRYSTWKWCIKHQRHVDPEGFCSDGNERDGV